MIDIDRTLSVLGVDVSILTPGSGKKVFKVCEGCGRYALQPYYDAIRHHLCKSCANKSSNLSAEHIRNLQEMWKGRTHTEATKKKMSAAKKGENHPNYGKTLPEETRKKIAEAGKGRIYSEETRRKISIASSNRSDESRKKMSEAHLAMSEETRRKMSAAQQGIPYEEWDGFKRFGEYCPKFNEAFKESIREKFGRVCFLCPKTEEENGRKLSVHHVNYDKNCLCDDAKCEFVPVCMSCHNKTNRNREHWENVIMTKLKVVT